MCRTFPCLGVIDFSLQKLFPSIACQPTQYIAWQSKTCVPHKQTPSFFPSAQMKNERHKPHIPTETQAIPARTQSNQTSRRSGDYRQHRNCTNYIVPNLAVSGNVPAAAVFPGKRLRGVGEIGDGLRRVRLLSL